MSTRPLPGPTRPAAAGRVAAQAGAPAGQELVRELTTSVKDAGSAYKGLLARVTPQLQAANVRIFRHARGKADKVWLKVAASADAVKSLLGAYEPQALEPLPSPDLEKKYGQLAELSDDAGGFFARNGDPNNMAPEDRKALPSMRSLTAELSRCASKVKSMLTGRPDTALGRARQGRELKLADIRAQQQAAQQVDRASVQSARDVAVRQQAGRGLYDEESTEG